MDSRTRRAAQAAGRFQAHRNRPNPLIPSSLPQQILPKASQGIFNPPGRGDKGVWLPGLNPLDVARTIRHWPVAFHGMPLSASEPGWKIEVVGP